MRDDSVKAYVKPIAQTGLIAKGIVYCLMGALAFMAAFNIAGQSTQNTDKRGVFNFVEEQIGGQFMLVVIAMGLICYSLWRAIQTFGDTEDKGHDAKGIFVRSRYFFSGLVYSFLALVAIKIVSSGDDGSGDGRKDIIADFLHKPYGSWVIGVIAGVVIGVGLYQTWYGLSGNYKKHVQKAGGSSNERLLVSTGKLGYVARGIVWLVLGWMLTKAAYYSNSSAAGDTSEAFAFVQNAAYGTYLLAAIGFGLICYGIFNFIRVKFEKFA